MKLSDYQHIFTDKPCTEAIVWLETQPDPIATWDSCERGDWMWWALCYSHGHLPTKAQSVDFANWCKERAAASSSATADYVADYAAAAAYYAAAWMSERKAQAEWIRQHITCPFGSE